MKLKSLFYLVLLTSCVHFHYTDINQPNGIRPNKPDVFKYKKTSLISLDKTAIDLNSIYIIDSQFNKFNYKLHKPYRQFIRFFSGGQVLLASCDSLPSIELINNKQIGYPGYFYIKKDELRMQFLDETNGGQIMNRFGKILNNGDIMLYESQSKYMSKSFKKLENQGQKTFWKKIAVSNVLGYTPDW